MSQKSCCRSSCKTCHTRITSLTLSKWHCFTDSEWDHFQIKRRNVGWISADCRPQHFRPDTAALAASTCRLVPPRLPSHRLGWQTRRRRSNEVHPHMPDESNLSFPIFRSSDVPQAHTPFRSQWLSSIRPCGLLSGGRGRGQTNKIIPARPPRTARSKLSWSICKNRLDFDAEDLRIVPRVPLPAKTMLNSGRGHLGIAPQFGGSSRTLECAENLVSAVGSQAATRSKQG
jgi:hypothetical protein